MQRGREREGARGRMIKELKDKRKNKKIRSSRGKAPLRMTSAVSDEILTDSKSESSG
jgi:hypothetical protein